MKSCKARVPKTLHQGRHPQYQDEDCYKHCPLLIHSPLVSTDRQAEHLNEQKRRERSLTRGILAQCFRASPLFPSCCSFQSSRCRFAVFSYYFSHTSAISDGAQIAIQAV